MTRVSMDWRRWFVGGASAAVGAVALSLLWRLLRNASTNSEPTLDSAHDDFVVAAGPRVGSGKFHSDSGRGGDTDVTPSDLMASRRGTGVYVDELTRSLCVEEIKQLLPVVGGKVPVEASATDGVRDGDSAASNDSYVTDLELETQIAFEMESALREEILQIGPLVEAELRGGTTTVRTNTTWRRLSKKTAKRCRNPVRKFLELALEYLEVNQERLRMAKRLREQNAQQLFHPKNDYASHAHDGNGGGRGSGYVDYFEDDDDDDDAGLPDDIDRGRWAAQHDGEEEWSDDDDVDERGHEEWEDEDDDGGDDGGLDDDNDIDDYAEYEQWLLQNGVQPDSADALTEDDVEDLIRAGFEKELLGHVSTIKSVLLARPSQEQAAVDSLTRVGNDDEEWITDEDEEVDKARKAPKRAGQSGVVVMSGKTSVRRGQRSKHA